MKYLRSLCLLLLSFISTSLLGNSITAYNNQTAYVPKSFVFHNGALAQGFVRLNEGFTVAPHSSVNMDVLFSVSGGIDLRETSTIRLLKDLKFDSGVTLTTGGNIDGRGHTLILNGNFRIPDGKVLHFNGDTILDARGNEIIIGENSEIFVDTNVTLTILNATIKTTRNAPTFPALRCGAFNSKLALDNVVLEPADDFLFLGGRFFIHNDVAITGTSAFVYNSPVPSFITQNSCLYLDHAITFSMAPATYTDAPYSLKNTYTDNNFIKMADDTSVLCLNGCTLQTTNTGWRLTTGTVSFDDRVQIKTDPTLTMTALEPCAREKYIEIDSMAWHPNGNYIAVNIFDPLSPASIVIYRFDGSSLTLVASYDDGQQWYGMQWSPDGRYLVIGRDYNSGLYGLKIFSFDGASLTLVTDIGGDTGGSPCWSPDGQYLAFTTNGGNILRICRFDGSSLIDTGAQISASATQSLRWSKNGRSIISGGFDGLRVYDFDGTALTLRVSAADIGINDVALSPDGRYIGAIFYEGRKVIVYRFDGNSLVLDDRISTGPVWTCDWSADGRYFSIGYYDNGGAGPAFIQVYSFDGKKLTLIPGSVMEINDFIVANYISMVRFSPNGKYLAMGGLFWNGGSALDPRYDSLMIYAVDYVQTTSPQTLATSMVIGDSAKGSAYDAHLRLQPGASVNLAGKMLYDNVN
jgi:WD40 repeat protein